MNDPIIDTLVLFSKEEDIWVARKPKEGGGLPYMKFNDFLEEEGASFRVVLAVDDRDELLADLGVDVGADWVVPHDEE